MCHADDTPISGVDVSLFPGACPADLNALPARIGVETTDADGLYLFSEVQDGSYCVVSGYTGPGEPLQGAAGQTVTVSGGAELDADFGYAPSGSIGDTTYLDRNNDLSFDAADTVIPDIQVSLYDGLCPADLSTLGDSLRTTLSDACALRRPGV